MIAYQTVLSELPSDRDLASRVSAYLSSRHVPTLRQVKVQARDGIVTLRGQVRSFYEKQLSHQCGRRVAGVLQIVDEIDVHEESEVVAVELDPRRYTAVG